MIIVNGKELEQRFNQLLSNKKFTCTSDEFDMFVNYGLLLKSGKKYVTRNNVMVNLEILENKTYNMTINLSGLISKCTEIGKEYATNKVYCMSTELYNKYEKSGLILNRGSKKYFRLFENELWAVFII